MSDGGWWRVRQCGLGQCDDIHSADVVCGLADAEDEPRRASEPMLRRALEISVRARSRGEDDGEEEGGVEVEAERR